MTRIFWDTMLFVYLLQNNPSYFKVVEHLLQRSYERKDVLYTSCLAVGELMAGPLGVNAQIRDVIQNMGFQLLPFDENGIASFGRLRSQFGIKAPDAIHLACAATAGMDLFLTGDTGLLKKSLIVPGIQFISNFETAPL